jgi:hypothetical protein
MKFVRNTGNDRVIDLIGLLLGNDRPSRSRPVRYA